jgi:hypothetical protein
MKMTSSKSAGVGFVGIRAVVGSGLSTSGGPSRCQGFIVTSSMALKDDKSVMRRVFPRWENPSHGGKSPDIPQHILSSFGFYNVNEICVHRAR